MVMMVLEGRGATSAPLRALIGICGSHLANEIVVLVRAAAHNVVALILVVQLHGLSIAQVQAPVSLVLVLIETLAMIEVNLDTFLCIFICLKILFVLILD